jgi:LPXTG-motif cell wall-anchored protein
VKSGGTYSHNFSTAGTFAYVCTLHPQMTGTVKVLAGSSSGGGTGGGQGSGGGGGSDPTGTSSADPGGGSTTGAGSESAAVSSADAAGSSSSLPATGLDTALLAAVGGLLLGTGVALRRRAPPAR